jgi:paraquat-inducible protein B
MRIKLMNADNQIESVSNGLHATMGNANRLLGNVDGEVDPISSQVQDTLGTAQEVLDQATTTLQAYERLVDGRSEMRRDIHLALSEIALAARSMRAFTDFLEQHPEALIRGKGSGGE